MERARLAGLCLVVSAASLMPSSYGLVSQNQYITVVGYVTFAAPLLILFSGLYLSVPRTEQFWLNRFLNGVGSFGLFSRIGFELQAYVEGSLLFSGFLIGLFIYGHSISGAISYVGGQGFSAVLFFSGFALIMASVVNYSVRLRDIDTIVKLCKNEQVRERLSKRLERYMNLLSFRPSLAVFLLGTLVNAVGFCLLGSADGIYGRMQFYVSRTYEGPLASVYVLEPLDVLGVISQQIGISIMSGFLSVSALMILITLSLLTYLNTDSVGSNMVLDAYDISPLRRVSKLLTSFWVLTSSGLTIFPLLTVIGTRLVEANRPKFAEVQFLMALIYPVFLVSMFVLSSALVRRFISSLKAQAADKTFSAMRNARGVRGSYDELATELSLFDRIPEGPAGGIFMQLFQVFVTIGLALLNLFRK